MDEWSNHLHKADGLQMQAEQLHFRAEPLSDPPAYPHPDAQAPCPARRNSPMNLIIR